MDVGDRFPVEELGLSEQNGPLVVYFYPQAGTPGCTLEAHEFNRNDGCLETADVGLVGVSIDPSEANETFAQDCGLEFPLVSDEGAELTTRRRDRVSSTAARSSPTSSSASAPST